MRFVSFLTACLVTAALYLMVMERDRVMEFVGRGAPEETAAAENPAPATTAPAAAPAPDEPRRVSVVALHSVARPVAGAVLVRGRTEAARQVEVRAETTGAVISEPLRKGAFVAAGEVMCEIAPGTREVALAEAQARLAQARAALPESRARLAEAQARLSEAEINDRAAARLLEDGFATQTHAASTNAAVESAKAAVQAAKSGLEAAASGVQSAEAGVAAAEKEIERLTIEAPFAGLLETDSAELGALLQPGAPCATVIQLDPIKLVGFVPETEVDKVAVGARAGAKLATGRAVDGRVSFLGRSADPATRTFRVEIEIANGDLSIRDGQTAEIVISSGEQVAHLLPQSALTLDDAGRIGVRLVDETAHARFAPVTVLRDAVEGMWVAGLPDRADVIVVGQEYVTDGVPVTPTFREDVTQ
ncbi:efflux RND transporter periplasmic adaptor subunit [Actibacterium sp. MT2.3-13A]|uniref:efflux RND transporter periplasmic adaptor subunit n=1 Tax=Actibacterium sp. MT2.3-13A TaxID=2828332 RepID=UPI001BAC06F6|nr:efflux RND transporter periplasmic adaptor subunit [Actibacterium sp. MT2.3-13A]